MRRPCSKSTGNFFEEHVRQCEEIRAAFFSSDLMKRVKRSYCEVPFVVTIDGKPVTGKTDRLCEMDDGSWVVIDYKSESIASNLYPMIAEEYKISIRTYTNAIEQVVMGKDVEGLLYFTEIGEYSII
jgi:ATP-dependent helicase/nuclease subunit A